ncbi:MAG: hypothetical protein QXD29_04420, partial [Thermoplasmata archaeon]
MLNKYVNLELNGKKYIIYGTVRGLLDEENDMEKLYKEFAPDGACWRPMPPVGGLARAMPVTAV